MRLPDILLATWACPRCKGRLTPAQAPTSTPTLPLPSGEGRGEGTRAPGSTLESTDPDELRCENCHLAYPIRDTVPELLNTSARRY
ncbi:hypothetical protein JRI60_20015 [Archangium violaceum]|uniref:Trm112 family protein n=1 Tax=Archangium violaceum TaxID=83451 RepID=UPI001950CB6E|nr:hypothetical protein JRI60_20015 [Archangium violaceum]